ncbi:hypothetical protein [Rhizobium sp. P28RR-XV]|uniref:hypothetical protein n=1 Tax=Rhizobium sp. P28RR-XV TaxID=2726737 RepID=UPI001456A864|nr:hypothetical protein [Rhizobium sp. P28RR-XV]NLR86248.1 hypothetical protein [Rhizobium sp. P28RR-XV]
MRSGSLSEILILIAALYNSKIALASSSSMLAKWMHHHCTARTVPIGKTSVMSEIRNPSMTADTCDLMKERGTHDRTGQAFRNHQRTKLIESNKKPDAIAERRAMARIANEIFRVPQARLLAERRPFTHLISISASPCCICNPPCNIVKAS